MQKNTLSVIYSNPSGLIFRHCLNIADEIREHGYLVDHSHSQYELYYLISGDVTYHISDHEYKVHKGDILILNAFENHKVSVSSEEDYERYVIEFAKSDIPSMQESNPLNSFFKTNPFVDIIPANVVESINILEDFQRIESIVNSKSQYIGHIVLSNIISIVSKVADAKSNIDFPMTQDELLKGNNSVFISKTIIYINEHIGDKIKVDDIANSIFISKSYLQHLFKECIGMSLKQYIIKQKMQVAFSYLQTDMPFDEICTRLGYDYYTNFCSNFKRVYGYPPKRVKKK